MHSKDCLKARAILAFGGSMNNRNNSIFRGKEEEAWIVWDRAKILSDDFRIHNTVNKPILPLDPRAQKWEKPPIGYVKINVDVVETDNKIGFGVIIRDCDGFVIGGGTGFKYELTTSEWAELYALEEGVLLIHSFNVENVIFETDCASIVNRIRKRNKDITVIGHRIKEIRRSMELFSKVEVNWINRSCNKVADFICNFALSNSCNMSFGMDYPKDSHDFVILD
ncbi:hypothetical protein Gohar_015835 [Gossypium harknessii]|uniref:RNase H type-1 domain-containing protein n=1 Tax=Gossypium harknessii TaxID=34285 RepID=A0A7J9G156_9ROSI|nr:hypothetical protein [Gossypium harknessii]